MRNNLIYTFIFLCGSINAQINTFRPSVIIKNNGSQIECIAKYPASSYSDFINYKINENGKILKMKSDEIKTIRYILKDDKSIEKELLPYINLLDKNKDKPDCFAPMWMEVLVRGSVTLYATEEISKASRGQTTSKTFHFYCKREHEEHASRIAYISQRGNFNVYKMEADKYFADSPDISQKIKDEIEGYLAKDIVNIVKEYNAEKSCQ